jgi:hypothetical protein
MIGEISIDAPLLDISPSHVPQNWIRLFACGLRLRILISTNSLPRTVWYYSISFHLPSDGRMCENEGNLDLQGKVVGILSAGFHPNDFLIGGTVRTIVGPVLSVIVPSYPISTLDDLIRAHQTSLVLLKVSS